METQSIPTVVTSPKAPAETHKQKPRYTRAEKRQYAREKKAAAQAAQALQKSKKHGRKPTEPDLSKLSSKELDSMIMRLVKLRSEPAKGKRLEERLTREKTKEKPKKELSPKKLEKIEKRRQIRAERKAVWLAKKTAEGATTEAAEASLPAPAPAPAPAPTSQQPAIELDDDDFDLDY